MDNKTGLSVIMPVHNGGKYIIETLDNIVDNINNNDQLLIVLDNTTDNSLELISKFFDINIKFDEFNKQYSLNVIKYNKKIILDIFEVQFGAPSRSRNHGIKRAIHDYIAFIDQDDLWVTNKNNNHLELLKNNINIDVVLGETRIFSDNPKLLEKYAHIPPEKIRYHLVFGATTFRKKVFEQLGLIDEDLYFNEDTDFFIRMGDESVNIFTDDREALIYRLHETNMTRASNKEKNSQLIQVLFKSIKRRKKLSNKNIKRNFLNVTN